MVYRPHGKTPWRRLCLPEGAGRYLAFRLVLALSGPCRHWRGRRKGRAHLVRALSPRAVVVNARQIDSLVRRLTRQEGVPPHVSGLSGPEVIPPTAYSWLALRLYQDLGRFVDLPARLPAGLLDGLAAGLDDSVLAAVEGLVAQTIDRLQQAIEGRAAFPSWPEAGLSPSEALPVIEQAIAAGQPVELLYYALITDMVVRRVVEPHRVEWWGRGEAEEGGVPYLIGFCRWAQAERTFRVDRIREISVVVGDEFDDDQPVLPDSLTI